MDLSCTREAYEEHQCLPKVKLHGWHLHLCADALEAYEWLLCYIWLESRKKLDRELASGKVGRSCDAWPRGHN